MRAEGIQLYLHVRPRASKASIGGTHDGALQIRVRATPSEGAANTEVCQVLADALGVRRRSIQILSGHKGRRKRIAVEGDPDTLAAALALLAGSERPV